MTNAACQLGGYIICLICGVMTVTAIGLPYWSRDTHSGQIIEAMGYSYGLWWRCIYVATGAFTCDAYDRIFLGLFDTYHTAHKHHTKNTPDCTFFSNFQPSKQPNKQSMTSSQRLVITPSSN